MIKIHVVDAGHCVTEFPIVKILAEKLRAVFDKLGYNIEVAEDKTSRDVYKFISKECD